MEIEMTDTEPPMIQKQSDAFVTAFERLEREGVNTQPAWLFALRKAGLARFAELGFPTLQHEDWRFTNLAPLARLPFKPLLTHAADGVAAEALSAFPLARLPGSRLVFVDGQFSARLSSSGTQPRGVRVGGLAAALRDEPGLVVKHLAKQVMDDSLAFTALNMAFFQDGAFIYVPAGAVIAQPVQLIFASTGREAGATAQPRNLIVAEAGSQLTVVETYVGAGDAATFTNTVTEFAICDGAVVEHCRFQDESKAAFHLAALHAVLGRGCNFTSHSFALGARLSRVNIRAKLDGEGLETVLNGLYLTRGEQLADHHMIVEHARPRCAGHEYFNGILDDKSKGVFHGRILVRPEAQKTDAKQTNKNLLLSDDATADAKPQLEIYADDVKCTHGATIGQLNDESIYYLRSRGIGLERAKRMLIHAFAGEIIDRVRCEALREELDKLVWDRLEQNPRLAEPTR